jgi:hypothetical protein
MQALETPANGIAHGCIDSLVALGVARTFQNIGLFERADGFVKALNGSTFARSFFGNPDIRCSASKRLGNNQARMAQMRHGRWVNASDFVQ